MKYTPRPDRQLVIDIATREAFAAGANLNDVLSMARDGRSRAARRRAMARIMEVSGCSPTGLAEIWGCDVSIAAKLAPPKPPKPQPVIKIKPVPAPVPMVRGFRPAYGFSVDAGLASLTFIDRRRGFA